MSSLNNPNDLHLAIQEGRYVVFQQIFEDIKVELDEEFYDPPWEEDAGLEHTTVPMRSIESSSSWHHWKGDDLVLHYAESNVVHLGHSDTRLLLISREQMEHWGLFAFHHGRGHAKQVAREMEAAERRATLDLLRELYENGWDYWSVTYEKELDGVEYEFSAYRIDDLSYAEKDMRLEAALTIAQQMSENGILVSGLPRDTRETKKRALREKISRNLDFKNVESYEKWLKS